MPVSAAGGELGRRQALGTHRQALLGRARAGGPSCAGAGASWRSAECPEDSGRRWGGAAAPARPPPLPPAPPHTRAHAHRRTRTSPLGALLCPATPTRAGSSSAPGRCRSPRRPVSLTPARPRVRSEGVLSERAAGRLHLHRLRELDASGDEVTALPAAGGSVQPGSVRLGPSRAGGAHPGGALGARVLW